MDLALLLARDHDQLDRAIAYLLEPSVALAERQSALEAARVSFATHADAEASVLHAALGHVAAKQDLVGLVAQVLAAHRIQESILRRMDIDVRRNDWMCAAIRLRRTLLAHAEQEQQITMRVLRDCVPAAEYIRLAGAYATEKMRAVGMMASLVPSRRAAIRGLRRATR